MSDKRVRESKIEEIERLQRRLESSGDSCMTLFVELIREEYRPLVLLASDDLAMVSSVLLDANLLLMDAKETRRLKKDQLQAKTDEDEEIPESDYVDERFGKLMVIGIAPRNKHGHFCYHCRCDCGREMTVRRDSLRNGQKSCQPCGRKWKQREKDE